MPTIIQGDSSTIEIKRDIIREALDDIANEIGIRLQEGGLSVPVFFSVPSIGGKAILTFATPIEPAEDDWSSVSAIICEIAGKRLDGISLIGQEIRSAMANVPKMSVAEVIAD